MDSPDLTLEPLSFLGSHTPGKRMKPPTNWESSEDSMKGDRVEPNLEERAGCDRLEKDIPGGVSHTGDKIERRWGACPRRRGQTPRVAAGGCQGCSQDVQDHVKVWL